MLWQGSYEALKNPVLSLQLCMGLAGSGFDPRPKKRRQRRLSKDCEAEATFAHKRQPADDLVVLYNYNGVPGPWRHRVEPPWLLEERAREAGDVTAHQWELRWDRVGTCGGESDNCRAQSRKSRFGARAVYRGR